MQGSQAAATASGNGGLKSCWSTRASVDRTLDKCETSRAGAEDGKQGQHYVRCHPLPGPVGLLGNAGNPSSSRKDLRLYAVGLFAVHSGQG